jgi:hypothetical protein
LELHTRQTTNILSRELYPSETSCTQYCNHTYIQIPLRHWPLSVVATSNIRIVPPNTAVTVFTLLSYTGKGKGKGKVHPRTGQKGPEGDDNICTLSLTWMLDRGGGRSNAPATLTPGNTRYPLHRMLGGPQARSGRVRKTPPPELDPWPFSP